MGGKTSKNKQAGEVAKKIAETPNIPHGSRPTDKPIASAGLHRTQSLREQRSKPRHPVSRSESSRSSIVTPRPFPDQSVEINSGVIKNTPNVNSPDRSVIDDVQTSLCTTPLLRKPTSPPTSPPPVLPPRSTRPGPSRTNETTGYAIVTPRPFPESSVEVPSGVIRLKNTPNVNRLEVISERKEFKRTVIEPTKSNALLVAAIDFGTTYSGYAYSFIEKPEKIWTNYWESSSVKTPTVVLMDSDKRFHSFGEKARKKYEELMKKNTHTNWYLFERFKMKLFVKEKPLQKDMEIEDILGKPMKAIDVFTAAIRYIREHLLGVLNDPNSKDHVEIKNDTDIRWVLTVPAIWNDLSKKFMREAANNAGIPDEMLLLALEPEAASLFCKKKLDINVPVGCRYLVLDLGGGTADVTCHEVNRDGTLKELYPPTGGAFGGTTVDNGFISVLVRIFGGDVIKAFKSNHMSDFWELMTDFELKKRTFDGSGRVALKFPVLMLNLFADFVGESVEDALRNSKMTGIIEFKQGKMFIAETLMKDIFNSAVTKIKEKTEELLKEVPDISSILLVGGFSESLYLQKVMRESYDNLIVLPKEPSGAVLNGAVIYGHETKAISSRICRYTYGIARMIKFIPGMHPEKKKVPAGDFTYCDDAFNKHIEIGTKVSVNTPAKAHEYFPSAADQRHAVLEVYKSKHRNPMFIDEVGCEFVGLIKVDIDPKGDVWAKLLVKLIFGGTELKIEVKDEKNGTITTGSVDFLG